MSVGKIARYSTLLIIASMLFAAGGCRKADDELVRDGRTETSRGAVVKSEESANPTAASVKPEPSRELATPTRGPGDDPHYPCGPHDPMYPDFPIPHAQFVEWTPDDSHILFDYGTAIMIVDAAGSGWRTLVDANPGYELRYGFHADISPDGQRVVYSSCEFPTGAKSERGSFNYEIASVNLDGSDPRRLTENEGPDLFPAWSSDGANLALFSSEVYWSNHPELDIIRYGGSDQGYPWLTDALDGKEGFVHHPPQWEPNGTRLAFLTYRADPFVWSVYIIESDGTGLRRISETVGGFSWSPDGARIALAKPRGDDLALYAIPVDGAPGELIEVVPGGPVDRGELGSWGHWVDPVEWSPSGEHILFLCESRICVVDTAGNRVGRSPYGLPAENGRPKAAWSSDGSRIAVRMPRGSEVVLYTMGFDGTDVRVLVNSEELPGEKKR